MLPPKLAPKLPPTPLLLPRALGEPWFRREGEDTSDGCRSGAMTPAPLISAVCGCSTGSLRAVPTGSRARDLRLGHLLRGFFMVDSHGWKAFL